MRYPYSRKESFNVSNTPTDLSYVEYENSLAEGRKRFAFVDLNNFTRNMKSTLTNEGIPEDLHKYFLVSLVLRHFNADRYYIYDAVESLDNPDDTIEELRSLPRMILRSTSLRHSPSGRRKQEGVDVKLAVDALQHSYRKSMSECMLFSGDGDFLPLLEAVVETGIVTTVVSFSDPNKGVVTPALRNASDFYIRIDMEMMVKTLDLPVRTLYHKNRRINQPGDGFYNASLERVEIDGKSFDVLKKDNSWFLILERSQHGTAKGLSGKSLDAVRLGFHILRSVYGYHHV